jgi:hypothetical protein
MMRFDWDLYLWGWVTAIAAIALTWPVIGVVWWIIYDEIDAWLGRID